MRAHHTPQTTCKDRRCGITRPLVLVLLFTRFIVGSLESMAKSGAKLDDLAVVQLLEQLVQAHHIGPADNLYRLLRKHARQRWENLSLETLLSIVKLCGRHSERFATNKMFESGESWSQSKYNRKKTAGWKSARLAGQVWHEIEARCQGNEPPYPSPVAHESLLLIACKRGDILFMRQTHNVMEQRFPDMAASLATRQMFLKGCVAGADADAALQFLQATATGAAPPPSVADCEHVFSAVSTLHGYQHLAATTTLCWDAMQREANPSTSKDQVATLNKHICFSFVLLS